MTRLGRMLLGFCLLGLMLVMAGASVGLVTVGYRWMVRWFSP